MKKAAIYIRVSTTEQAAEGYSVAAQKDKLIGYCNLRDWAIQDTYVDAGFTGTNMNRPGIQKLLENLDEIDIVLVYKLDRLSRNQRDILFLVEEKFLERGIDFVSILENFDTSTPFGRAMMGILAVFAQLERDTIVERTKLGKERRAKEGYWNGGPAPIGYDLIDGRLVINEYEAMQVKEVLKLYRKYGQNKTATIMNEKGYKTKYGKWHGRSIARLVSNPIYTGMIHYKDDLYEGVHDSIISKEEFKNIQSIISGRSKNKKTQSKYLLGGLLWCGYCGARLKSSFSINRKNGTRYYYYLCYSVSKRPLHMVKDPNCIGIYWKMSDLESKVLDQIKKIKLDKYKFINQYEIYYNTNKNSFNKIEILKNKITNINKKIDKLVDLYQINQISIDTISHRVEKLYEEKKMIENNIKMSKVNKENKDKKIPLDILLNIFSNFEILWKEATQEERRRVLNMLIKKIIVTDSVEVEWNI